MGKSDRKSPTLSQKELAKVLGLTTRQVRNLEAEGMPARSDGRSKFYPVPDAVEWYYERKFASEDQDENVRRARVAKLKAETLKVEADNAERLGQLIHVSDVEAMVAAPLKQVAAALKNAPARHASKLAKLAGVKVAPAKQLLDDVMQEAIEDMRRIRHPEEEEED